MCVFHIYKTKASLFVLQLVFITCIFLVVVLVVSLFVIVNWHTGHVFIIANLIKASIPTNFPYCFLWFSNIHFLLSLHTFESIFLQPLVSFLSAL